MAENIEGPEQTTQPTSPSPLQDKLNLRKSRVRVVVTYLAASFLFLVGPVFSGWLFFCGDKQKAIDLFMTILPVASAIVSFWFAGRGQPTK